MNRREKTSMHAQSENCAKSRHLCRSRTTYCNPRGTLTGQAGFTIVEVMVAVVVFAVGLIAIGGMQTHSLSQATFSDQISTRVNAITHRAESLIRMPITDDPFGIDVGGTIAVEVNEIFEEENMCDYEEECDWSYVDYEDTSAHTVRQRVVQGYPLPALVTIELEVAPQHVSPKLTELRTVRVAYVRSTRWN